MYYTNFQFIFFYIPRVLGNFLLLPDGRIGLIDYGATKRLTYNERITSCLLFAALHRNDENKLYQMSKIQIFFVFRKYLFFTSYFFLDTKYVSITRSRL